MNMVLLRKLALASCIAVLLTSAAATAFGQTHPTANKIESAKPPYTPRSGQSGKDVIWLPTPQALVDRMLDMARLTKDDYLVDLGSGDGRTVITAARRGIRAHGLEYNPKMVDLAAYNARQEGVAALATFARADIFQSDFSSATVVALFLLPELNLKLRPTLLDMKPGTRVVSNSFNMGDWQPDELVEAGGDCKKWCYAYKWIIPAKVGGSWRLGNADLKLTQTFQFLEGALTENGETVRITEARLTGADIMFTAGGKRYYGRVDGATITGRIDGAAEFTATRD
jgi:hypothetical protein